MKSWQSGIILDDLEIEVNLIRSWFVGEHIGDRLILVDESCNLRAVRMIIFWNLSPSWRIDKPESLRSWNILVHLGKSISWNPPQNVDFPPLNPSIVGSWASATKPPRWQTSRQGAFCAKADLVNQRTPCERVFLYNQKSSKYSSKHLSQYIKRTLNKFPTKY